MSVPRTASASRGDSTQRVSCRTGGQRSFIFPCISQEICTQARKPSVFKCSPALDVLKCNCIISVVLWVKSWSLWILLCSPVEIDYPCSFFGIVVLRQFHIFFLVLAGLPEVSCGFVSHFIVDLNFWKQSLFLLRTVMCNCYYFKYR